MSTGPVPLDADESAAWRALARVMIQLPRALDDDLVARDGISLTRYVVLMRLSEAPERSLRMKDLAAEVALSPSRVTRVVQDLVADGYVERVPGEDDKRARTARLSDSGLARLEAAWPAHLAGVRHLVLDRLDPADIAHLTRILAALGDPPAVAT